MSDLRYPQMRLELIEYINALSDISYQNRVWVGGILEGPVVHDEFDYAIHFLYDDTSLASDPFSMIGEVLRNSMEAEKISTLIKAIDLVFDKYGTKLSDAEYLRKPEWEAVVLAAQDASNAFLER